MIHRFDSFPFPVNRFQAGPHSMAFRDQRPSSSDGIRGTILCVHGNPTWSFYYRKIIERFEATHRVVAVDHIGCGESDKPSQDDYTYRLSDHQENLIALIDALNLQDITLVAHDWGGAIGLGALVARKERFRRIVLLNTGAFPPPYVPLRIRACRIPWLGSFAMRQFNLFARAAVHMAVSRSPLPEEAREGLLAPYRDWDSRVAIDAFVRDIPLSRSHPTYETLAQLEQDLPTLADLPSLLIWGMKDWCFRPSCLRRFESVWPNAETVEISDAGHYVLEDAPEETLNAIASFLQDSRSVASHSDSEAKISSGEDATVLPVEPTSQQPAN